jgi:hypothetical protein
MHDPMSVAFEIKSPIRHKSPLDKMGYRTSLVTIWHVDPQRNASERGCRSDDTCGWFTPPTRSSDRERIRKLGAYEFRELFANRWAQREKVSYAGVCRDASTYEAVYWAWRRVKFEMAKGWKYGDRRVALTPSELEEIMRLSSNPVDNLRITVEEIKDEDACGSFFIIVYRAYMRHKRPWWQHPRWHFWHWRFQIYAWQTFRRWLLTRCAACGKPFAWGECPTSHGWDTPKLKFMRGEVGCYHSDCSGAVMHAVRESQAATKQ